MASTIKTLPIVERWDCSGCGNCCRGSVIPLSDDDLQRLEKQGWEKHPDFLGVAATVKQGWGSKRRQLAQRPDGSCVFLTDDNRCRIHAEHGADAKPLVCRMYPLQLVPREKSAILTLRRSCPSAAAEEGRELKDHRDAVKKLAREGHLLDKTVRAPRITTWYRGSWQEALRVTGSIERLLADERFPLVRRLAHATKFCSFVDAGSVELMDALMTAGALKELEERSRDEVSGVFRDRQPPPSSTGTMYRQAAAEYVRLHSTYRATGSWRERWMLVRSAFAFARGRGKVPPLHPLLPEVTFEQLEESLGHLSPELQQPLTRFFEANASSLQYTIAARPGWSITESLRAMAIAFPIGMWLLRWCSHGREPTVADVIEVVTMIDRGQGFQSLVGGQHRRRIALIARDDGLEKLIAWYAQ